MHYLTLIAFAGLLAAGQILFKKAAIADKEVPGVMASYLNGWMLAALVLYAVASLIWVWVLRTTPLTIAYPFAALAFVIVPFFGWALFNELIGYRYVIGCTLILAGIILTSGNI